MMRHGGNENEVRDELGVAVGDGLRNGTTHRVPNDCRRADSNLTEDVGGVIGFVRNLEPAPFGD